MRSVEQSSLWRWFLLPSTSNASNVERRYYTHVYVYSGTYSHAILLYHVLPPATQHCTLLNTFFVCLRRIGFAHHPGREYLCWTPGRQRLTLHRDMSTWPRLQITGSSTARFAGCVGQHLTCLRKARRIQVLYKKAKGIGSCAGILVCANYGQATEWQRKVERMAQFATAVRILSRGWRVGTNFWLETTFPSWPREEDLPQHEDFSPMWSMTGFKVCFMDAQVFGPYPQRFRRVFEVGLHLLVALMV